MRALTQATNQLLTNQVVRFLFLGGFAAAVNWAVRFPLSAILPFGAAVFLAYLIGMSVGFTLYRKYVFPGSTRPVVIQTLIFLGVNAFGAAVVLVLAFALLRAQETLPYQSLIKEALAHGLAIGIGAVVNFIGHKFLTFAVAPEGAPTVVNSPSL